MTEKNLFLISQPWLRVAGIVIFAVALFFFIMPMFVGIHHEGCVAGTIISMLGLVYFGLNPVIAGLLQNVWRQNIGHFVICIVLGFLGLGALLGLIFSVLMIRSACNRPENPATMVILGCKVKDGRPSLMLKKRLDAGADYLEQHPEISVIVSGGQGTDESISEAECMKSYLIQERGISPDRIFPEDQSISTQENFENSRAILEAQGLDPQIIIVTDGYHQYRASRIADGLGLEYTAVSARTSWYLVPSYWVREWLGICYQFVFG